jgi:hypothetical protein
MSDPKMELEFEELAPGIHVYKNVMKDVDLFLKNIKNVFDSNGVISWDVDALIIRDGKEYVDKTIRDVNVFSVPYKLAKVLLETHSNPRQTFNNIVANKLYESLDPIEKHYMSHYRFTAKEHDTYYVMKYEENNFFKIHTDDGAEYPRTLSLVYYLNSDYEGGEIEFPRFGVKYKPVGNDVILFPSNYMYDHLVHNVTSGDRFAVASWLMNNKYPEKKNNLAI